MLDKWFQMCYNIIVPRENKKIKMSKDGKR